MVPNDPRIYIFAVVRVFVLVWSAVAIANTVSPRWVWGLTGRWRAVREPAPTYFLIRRMIAIGILLLALGFFSLGILGG